MKRLGMFALALFAGYVVGAMTLLVWAGHQMYEGVFGDDD